MSQDVLATIGTAKHRIEAVRSTNAVFLDNARLNAEPQDVPAKLEFDDDELAVNIFGYRAQSKPRVVRFGDDYYIEYRLIVRFDGEDHEVTRFYVGAGGWIYEDLKSETKLCDFDNEYIASHVCRRVALGLLDSPVFAVAE